MFTFVVSSERRYSIVYMLTPAPPKPTRDMEQALVG
jgi:hypothetical protein